MIRQFLLALLCPLLFCAAGSAPSGVQGTYFDKHKYSPQPIPDFESSREQLPEPIYDGHDELLNLYWSTWKLAFSHFRQPPHGSPLVSNYMDAAFSDHIFQWDTIFMVSFADYANSIFPAVESLDNFYSRQHSDGYIDREIVVASGADYVYQDLNNTINPPLFAWAELRHAHLTGDTSRYVKVFPALVAYANYLEFNRHSIHTKHQLYWNTGLGAGMDNTPRSGSGWVDMSTQMVLMYQSLAEMAQTIGKTAEAHNFSTRATDIAARIQHFMWDERDGLYYDVDDDGNFIKHKTTASFWPLMARIPSSEQAARMVAHLQDEKTFWRENIWPSLAADEPEYSSDGHYWQGGVWAPSNAMILAGLELYPELSTSISLARQAADKYLQNMLSVFEDTGTIWEFYKPESAARGLIWWWFGARKDFVGWSGLGPIQFFIENILGFHVDALQQRLVWRISNINHHGIRKLPIGEGKITIEAAEQKSEGDALHISVEYSPKTDRQTLTLDIVWNGKHHQQSVVAGKTQIVVDR